MTASGEAAAVSRDFDIVLVLSGGNALGAFEAGVYETLHAHGLFPDWVIGASIGAINGALIAGSPIDRRIETLRSFWRVGPAGANGLDAWLPPAIETLRRTAAAGWTMMAGRPGVFGPLLSALAPWASDQPSIFETEQLADTLGHLVDLDRLNGGPCRFTATAVDLETGDDAAFDSRDRRIAVDHIRASAALPVNFAPVEIDGRWYADGGLSANLPLDPLFATPPRRPTLCIAVDLLPLGQRLPRTLGEAAGRMQDLIFAAQSRRSLARLQAAFVDRDDVSITLVRLAYADQAAEVAGKAMDFSGPTIQRRWSAGRTAAEEVVEALGRGALDIGRPGLRIAAE
jgi:NTE family protein